MNDILIDPHTAQNKRAVVIALLTQFDRMSPAKTEAAWDVLSAAHIVGQTDFWLHIQVHWAMLLFAAKNRDAGEILGQLFRLALIPLGHLFQRLPLGNVGRANVSAFVPMPVAPQLVELIHQADIRVKNGLKSP